MAAQYDLLLKGGTVVDPSQGLQQRCDVAFRDGRVAALAPDLPMPEYRHSYPTAVAGGRGMRRKLTIIVLACTMWLGISTASAGSVSPNSWRPYIDPTVLVTLGMSKGEVMLKAGKPATTELVSVGTDGHASITVWTYIRTGHNEEVANLTFSGNKLVKIELNLLKP